MQETAKGLPLSRSLPGRLSRLKNSDFTRQCPLLSALIVGLVIWLVYASTLSLLDIVGSPYDELMERINDLSLECGSQRQDGKAKVGAAEGSDIIRRHGFRFPSDLCGYSDRAIEKFMSLPHNCSRTANRVWVEGAWMSAMDMKAQLKPPPGEGVNPIECAVFCVDHEGPCHHDKCLIPIHVRRNSTDPIVAKQLLEDGEYDMVQPDMAFQTVLDAGANCGIATVIFATMFPEATIVSVEPSSANYAMLHRNTRAYRNVIPVHAGLWPRVAELVLTHGERTPGAYEWGFMVQEAAQLPAGSKVLDSLQGVSVDFLMEVFAIPGFDLLKIDIEGSEKELMEKVPSNPLKWLDPAKMAMFEVHEDMRSGSHDAVATTFWERSDWHWITRWGEYHIYKKKGWDTNRQR